ncbi:MAG: MucR family transcriptional regulator [Desulfobacterales bacterium]|nr:MucR family transcriptional regulator [Desulfobacterales bacterium]
MRNDAANGDNVRKRSSIVILPGFPYRRRLLTEEEVNGCFSGEKIQCLLCGNWYKKITDSHLARAHGLARDEYHQRYGIPRERTLRGMAGAPAKQMPRETRSLKRNARPSDDGSRMKPARKMGGRYTKWSQFDFDKILDRMQKQKRTLKDVCEDRDLPSINSWKRYAKDRPGAKKRARQIQADLRKSGYRKKDALSPGSRVDCERLNELGMSLDKIALSLGVSESTVVWYLQRPITD